MIMIIGGTSQGKKSFAGELKKEALSWTDGATANWKEFTDSRNSCHLHLFLRRLLAGDPALLVPEEWKKEMVSETFPARFASFLMEKQPERILVTDEIGYGIVPVDAFERRYREETGRVCCELAKEAEQVWRVCCGLGKRIK